jgi:signal transduction histidine kinase
MRSLIIDLLEYSHVGEAESKLENIDLNDLLKDVQQMNRDMITAKSATITTENLPLLLGYRVPLIQLFTNLLQNALKYSKEGVAPHIEIKAKEMKTHFEIAFSDNGIGIDSDYFDKIFIIFQRLHSSSEYGGTGIGLAIVKKVVDMHGGTIKVESSVGVGTTFVFTIRKSLDRNG